MSVPPPATNINIFAKPMPIEGTSNAPQFNNNNALVDYIYLYSSNRVKEIIQYMPEFDLNTTNRTWDAAKKKLLQLFGSTDVDPQVTTKALMQFIKKHSAESPFLKSQDITEKFAQILFVKGIPKSLQEWFLNKILEPNCTTDNPPTIDATYAILMDRYNRKGLFYEPDTKDTFSSDVSFDSTSNQVPTSAPTTATSSTQTNPNCTQHNIQQTTDVDKLTKAMEDLKLNKICALEAQVQELIAAMGSTASPNRSLPSQSVVLYVASLRE
ncbi:hypothetical protein VNI00_017359 [Paramarasmius palmivorus]|uniref:Uncharacterized protein n=1 Tax=Paramarasmius palmivorus TaxID=297713 RepID=A0AAW0B5H4_9AGAR